MGRSLLPCGGGRRTRYGRIFEGSWSREPVIKNRIDVVGQTVPAAVIASFAYLIHLHDATSGAYPTDRL